MIKLIYPDPAKLKAAGVKPVASVSLRWTDRHPQSSYGQGVLLYGKSSDIFDGQSFRAARDHFGAQLVYNDIELRKISSALGVPQDEPGIIEAYTQAGYAALKSVSRQYIGELVAAGKLRTIRLGELVFVV
ncbi:MAG: hypothetical protein WC357_06210 [Candidatus Omnitrophota bacterium]|jgi:hypothetical protein